MKKKISDFFKPILTHGEELSPKKWINSFLFLVGIQFLWLTIEVISTYETMYGTYELLVSSVLLLYIIVTCFLLYKRKKWGWILLFSEKLFTGIYSIFFLIIFTLNEYLPQEELNGFFWGIIISALFISYLIKKEIYTYFKIDEKEKIIFIKRISIVTATLSITGALFIYFYSL